MIFRLVTLGFVAVLMVGVAWYVAPRDCYPQVAASQSQESLPMGRVFYIDSYEPNYVHSRWTYGRAQRILKEAGVTIQAVHMNAKNQPSDAVLQENAKDIVVALERFDPDVVIAADDPACQYVVAPYLKGSRWPVVFVGVNWDASPYGLPCANVTGQIEVQPAREGIAELRPYAQGDRAGFLLSDTRTNRKILYYYEKLLGITWTRVEMVRDFATWKELFIAMQDDVNMLIIGDSAGIEGWDMKAAQAFVYQNTRIPTGGAPPHMASLAMISYVGNPREMGEYAGRTALEVLHGRDLATIPVTTTQQTRVYLNMRLAKMLGVRFPMSLIERATFVE